MSQVNSSGAVDGARIRRSAARLVRERELEQSELITVLQAQYEIPERVVREELNACFDAGLLYRSGDGDNATVTSP